MLKDKDRIFQNLYNGDLRCCKFQNNGFIKYSFNAKVKKKV